MKKIILALFFLKVLPTAFAQNITGTATYQWKLSSQDFEKETLSDPKMDPKMKAFIEERMKKMFSKTFILNFDNNSSIYKEEVNLDSQTTDLSNSGLNIASYKNIKEKNMLIQKEFMGKIFTIKDSLRKYNWIIKSDTKKIGDYNCYKAILSMPVSRVEIENFEKEKNKQANNPTQFLDIAEPTEKIVTAWYSPEIPASQGPEMYWGLPGLILEINVDKTTILCSKIVISRNNPLKIILPQKGKIVTLDEYDNIVLKKRKELEEVDYMPGN